MKIFYARLLCIAIANVLLIQVKAETRTADVNNISQIINWMKDGITTKIIFPAGTYNFTSTISLENDDLILEGSGMNETIIRLAAKKNTLIDAKGNNARICKLTLDGGKNQKAWGNPIFRFNKSKGHHFEEVLFTNSLWMGITGINAYATDGLHLIHCEFSNIDLMCLQIFNRNTNKRGGEVITSVDKVVIDGCIFHEGYETGVSSDNGNDREDSGDGTGRRYTESTSLSGTEIKNCVFHKSKQFHIAMVQSKNVLIQNNTFYGMTDDAGGGCQPIHMEQFTQNIEIYDNTFYMDNTVEQAYMYIHINGTEGHKRVTQQRPSNTYATWTYNVYGGNERRASTSCAKEGHINKDCKRDVHAYGPRNIYIAGNTFNESTMASHYVSVNEGENIQIGTKKDGTVSLNKFMGVSAGVVKIHFGGNDEGTGDVLIKAGQNITVDNVEIKDVNFDLPAIRLKKPIVIETKSDVSVNEIHRQDVLFYPNPASNFIYINSSEHEYSVSIFDITGAVRMSSVKKKLRMIKLV
ncbi:right-handed parallel beta-helix repeat-containing protein [Saccharicrinis fermentans]|uniref:Parallel beta-helix repeat protein n=1 Tax=Saccharicrinis fermentans DSM 9555 = JCM 21142 TaxID=869213 RepID=W7YDG7_9BACT|nr:right-handed parallel beta-helix repeat-containing protein [Saccharicrinis fermentans]GAF05528.1 parallel beta-helix repeat protein [Saccharicrinis fermentans DSM 9555 = JCM 21142]